jgi:hypothetical protein
MIARALVTGIFILALVALGRVNGCNGSRPYGLVGVRAYEAINHTTPTQE